MPPKDRGEKELPQDKSDTHEHTRGVKRAREGSLEPTPSPNPTPLATKKNRINLDSTAEGEGAEEKDIPNTTTGGSGSGGKEKETKNVGEVRKKVEEMTWKEGQPKPVGGEEWEVIKEDEVREAREEASTSTIGTQGQEGESRSSTDLKRKTLERNESSILETEEPVKKAKEIPSPPPATSSEEPKPAAAPAPAKKPQSTFSAFSSSSSPFSSSARTSSPFASTSTSKPVSSAFGNYSSSSSPFARKPVAALDTKDKEKEAGPSSPAATAPIKSNPESGDKESPAAAATAPSTFGDILKESKADEEDTGDKVQMTEQDVHTGEEGEETVYQTRAKLYVMQSDGGWKERGVGTLRLNVRAEDGKGARLVMRAEGVLRLILNVSLYVGMSVLEDGKHVRSTVFEEKERRLVTFRLGSQKAAAELCANIQDHIPLESASTPAPDAPSPVKAAV